MSAHGGALGNWTDIKSLANKSYNPDIHLTLSIFRRVLLIRRMGTGFLPCQTLGVVQPIRRFYFLYSLP
jgi:hypothetical protein